MEHWGKKMIVRNLQLNNFRCFSNSEVTFEPDTTVFVAENGRGKTAILEGLTYLLGQYVKRFRGIATPTVKDSDFREEWMPRDGNGELVKEPRAPYMTLSALADVSGTAGLLDSDECVLAWDLSRSRDKSESTLKQKKPETYGIKKILHYADRFIDGDVNHTPFVYPVVAFYGTERAVPRRKIESGKTPHKEYRRSEAYRDALSGTLSYRKMVEWLLYVEDKERREIIAKHDFSHASIERDTIQYALEKMLPGFSNLRTIDNPLRLVVDVEESGARRTCLVDQQLSDGYKIVLVLVLDIVLRILEANGGLPNMTPKMLLDAKGVVLIDEVDLHLHPSWQQHVLTDLRRTFPRLQFIVTTHSPHVVASVPKENIRIISERGIRRLPGPTQGVEVQEILQRIFGTGPTAQELEIVGKLNRLIALTDEGYGETAEWRLLYDELCAYYGDDYGPLKGTVMHRDFLRKIKRDALNA